MNLPKLVIFKRLIYGVANEYWLSCVRYLHKHASFRADTNCFGCRFGSDYGPSFAFGALKQQCRCMMCPMQKWQPYIIIIHAGCVFMKKFTTSSIPILFHAIVVLNHELDLDSQHIQITWTFPDVDVVAYAILHVIAVHETSCFVALPLFLHNMFDQQGLIPTLPLPLELTPVDCVHAPWLLAWGGAASMGPDLEVYTTAPPAARDHWKIMFSWEPVDPTQLLRINCEFCCAQMFACREVDAVKLDNISLTNRASSILRCKPFPSFIMLWQLPDQVEFKPFSIAKFDQ